MTIGHIEVDVNSWLVHNFSVLLYTSRVKQNESFIVLKVPRLLMTSRVSAVSNRVLTGKQVVVFIRVNSVGFGVAGVTEQIRRFFGDVVGPSHGPRVGLHTHV